LRDKNKSAKKSYENAEVKSISAKTGYGNFKYSKKVNQHTLSNNISNINNNNNLNVKNKKQEINLEFSEEDDIANHNNNNNFGFVK